MHVNQHLRVMQPIPEETVKEEVSKAIRALKEDQPMLEEAKKAMANRSTLSGGSYVTESWRDGCLFC